MHISVLKDGVPIKRVELPIQRVDENGQFFVEYEGQEHAVEFVPLINPSHVIIIGGSDDNTTTTREHTAPADAIVSSAESGRHPGVVQQVRQRTDNVAEIIKQSHYY